MSPAFRATALALFTSTALLAQSARPQRNSCCPVTPESIAWAHYAAQAQAALRAHRSALPALPPAPAGVADLTFAEFFGAIGDRGPEYSEKIRALAGHRVRIAGFMVQQQVPTPGMFLLTALPAITHEIDYALCDDLPPATLHVFVPTHSDVPVPLTPGPLVLTGILEIGPHPEADGRNSIARLRLDPPAPVTVATNSR